jgi:hypothetical protein
MTVSEAYDLAPCEILRWLRVRGESEVEDRFDVGTLMALAFNDPKGLSRRIREHYDAKRTAKIAEKGGIEAVIALFRASGHRVVDETGKART